MSRQVFQPFKVVGQLDDKLEVTTPWFHADGTHLTVFVWKSVKDGYWKATDFGCAIQEYYNRHGQVPSDLHLTMIEDTYYPGVSLELDGGCVVASAEDFLSVVCAVGMAVVRFDATETLIDSGNVEE